ncbi:CU044_2847 family protein [Phormidesmis sp. 146-35]
METLKDSQIENIPVQLENGVQIRVEATVIGSSLQIGVEGEEIESDVGARIQSLKEVTDAIEGIAGSVVESLKKFKPSKSSIEFGVEFGYESGQLTALIVKGTSKANLKITMEWTKE